MSVARAARGKTSTISTLKSAAGGGGMGGGGMGGGGMGGGGATPTTGRLTGALEKPLKETMSGKVSPWDVPLRKAAVAGNGFGRPKLICPSPTKNGVSPAKTTCEAAPPTVTTGTTEEVDSGVAPAGSPVVGGFVTSPRPEVQDQHFAWPCGIGGVDQ